MFQSDSLSKVATKYSNALNLIDAIFALESCLQYQIVPLELFDNHLIVGMVDPKDRDTIRHISTITSSSGYSFYVQSIEAKTHQLILAAYLKLGSANSVDSTKAPQKFVAEDSFSKHPQIETALPVIDKSATLFDLPPEEINSLKRDKIDKSATLFDLPPEEINSLKRDKIDKSATLFDLPPEEINSVKEPYKKIESIAKASEKSRIVFSEPQINLLQGDNIVTSDSSIEYQTPIIDVQAQNVDKYLESFKNLPPRQLWQKLLNTILEEGTGKLCLQQNLNSGSIIYYQNEIAQSSLKKLPLDTFEAIIKEIKIMAQLPSNKLERAKKIAVKKFHNYQKVLLRIELLIGEFGEEATVQIMSGRALKIYEQKQSDKTLEQAISLGKKLEKALIKINLNQKAVPFRELENLKVIVKRIENQLNQL